MSEGLPALLEKYATLRDLRRARERGEPIPPKAVFRELAALWPGALHELDRLPIEEIEARHAAVRSALDGGPVAPWMTAMVAYHALYRAALYTKARLDRNKAPSAEEAASLSREASRHASIEVGPTFVQSVARPPGGRIGTVVIAEVAARAGASERVLLRAMFPTRRDLLPTQRERG